MILPIEGEYTIVRYFFDVNDTDVMQSTNSAGKYLKLANNTYGNSKLLERLKALKKFASIISRIQTHTPWFLKVLKV